ncbi:MAG: DUF2834 domain-containing protein, partial [Cyanobacteria bacterium P01_D01_bin.6]
MTKIKLIYLIATVVGTILLWIPFLPFVIEKSFSPYSIIQALYVNGASSGLSNDFFLSCMVFWVFVIVDAKQLNLKYWWLVIPSAPLIGLSMAFPAYLFIREHQQPNRALTKLNDSAL